MLRCVSWPVCWPGVMTTGIGIAKHAMLSKLLPLVATGTAAETATGPAGNRSAAVAISASLHRHCMTVTFGQSLPSLIQLANPG